MYPRVFAMTHPLDSLSSLYGHDLYSALDQLGARAAIFMPSGSLVWTNAPLERAFQHIVVTQPAFLSDLATTAQHLSATTGGKIVRLRLYTAASTPIQTAYCCRVAHDGQRALLVILLPLPNHSKHPPAVLTTSRVLLPDPLSASSSSSSRALDLRGNTLPSSRGAQRVDITPDFFFQTDGGHRLVFIPDTLPKIGHHLPRLMGRHLRSAMQLLGFGNAEALDRCLNARTPFTTLILRGMPNTLSDGLSLSLSGTPQFNAKNRFCGFAGNGAILVHDFDDEDETPVASASNTVVAMPSRGDARLVSLPVSRAAAETNPAPVSPSETETPASHLDQSALAENRPSLKPEEHDAFREIAKALGARYEGDPVGSGVVKAADLAASSANERETLTPLPASDVPPAIRSADPVFSTDVLFSSQLDDFAPGGTAANDTFKNPAPKEIHTPPHREVIRFDAGLTLHPSDAAPSPETSEINPGSASAPSHVLDDATADPVVNDAPSAPLPPVLTDVIEIDDADHPRPYAASLEDIAAALIEVAPHLQTKGRKKKTAAAALVSDTQNEGALSSQNASEHAQDVQHAVAVETDSAPVLAVVDAVQNENTADAVALAELTYLKQTIAEQDAKIAELHAVLNTATDGVVLLSKDGHIKSLNRAAEALFDYPSNEIKGSPFSWLFARDSQMVVEQYRQSLLEPGVASLLNDGREVIGRERQGRTLPLFITLGQLDSEQQTLCAVVRDLSDWKKAETALIDAKRQAENASASKSDLLAKISHALRTPLNAIVGFTEVMNEERLGAIGNSHYRGYLQDILDSAADMHLILSDLSHLAKAESGQLEMLSAEVDLNDLVQQAVAVLQPSAHRSQVIIRTSLAHKLPLVVADAGTLRQVVSNLVNHSIRLSPEGGQVIVSTALTEFGEVILRVRDTGHSMAVETLLSAAEKREKGDTVIADNERDMNLTLTVTRALAQANRARFSVLSTRGEGNLIEVAFPTNRVLV